MDYLNSNTEREYRQRGQHLTPYERGIIESLRRQSKSYRAIAKVVGCSPSTVYYEIKRGIPARIQKKNVVGSLSIVIDVVKKYMMLIVKNVNVHILSRIQRLYLLLIG